MGTRLRWSVQEGAGEGWCVMPDAVHNKIDELVATLNGDLSPDVQTVLLWSPDENRRVRHLCVAYHNTATGSQVLACTRCGFIYFERDSSAKFTNLLWKRAVTGQEQVATTRALL